MNQPKVSVGFINCNRLFYLKSSVESFLECTKDYENKELMIIDNASVENSTEEYLKEKEEQGFKIFRQSERDPSNEFAKSLNLFCEEATGEILIPLQADQQFIVRGGWLDQYVEFIQTNLEHVGCVGLDAQRQITNSQHKFSAPIGDGYKFFLDYDRPPIAGAADVMMSRKIVDMIYPWKERGNLSHEGGNDSETDMLNKISNLVKSNNLKLGWFVPVVPPAIAIYNEKGTNARVRGNRRYGDYFSPKESFKYYDYIEWEEALELSNEPDLIRPYSIEYLAQPIGWSPMRDSNGWAKQPIRPEIATPNDWVELK